MSELKDPVLVQKGFEGRIYRDFKAPMPRPENGVSLSDWMWLEIDNDNIVLVEPISGVTHWQFKRSVLTIEIFNRYIWVKFNGYEPEIEYKTRWKIAGRMALIGFLIGWFFK